VAGQGAGYGGHRFTGGFHDVVAAGAVDVHVDESGNGDLVDRGDFLGARW